MPASFHAHRLPHWTVRRGLPVFANNIARGIYATTLMAFFDDALRFPTEPIVWPPPSTRDPWDNGELLPIPPDTRFPGWRYCATVNRGGWECFDGLFVADTPGAEAHFAFDGQTLGILYQIGPESGDLEWGVDDSPLRAERLFDDHCEHCQRPRYRLLADGLSSGRHNLRIRVSPDRDPRSKGHSIRLASLMVRG